MMLDTLIMFSYGFGDEGDSYADYTLYESGGEVWLEAYGSGEDAVEVTKTVRGDALKELSALLNTLDIESWDGFSGSGEGGFSFTLSAQFEDGSVSATGQGAGPAGYTQAHESLAGYLDKLAK